MIHQRNRHQRRGANAIEFALTMPLFIFLVFSAIEFGYYFFITSLVEDATRQGCRTGSTVSMEASPDAIITAQESIASLLTANLGKPCTPETQCSVTVSVVTFTETDTAPEFAIEDSYLDCQAAAPFVPAIGILSTLPSTINTGLLYRLEYQD